MLRRLKKTVGGNASAAPRPGGPKKRTILVAAGLALLFLVGSYLFFTRGHVETDDAFVDGHIHPIAARVSGYVTTVCVEDNQRVEKGALLVELDPTDLGVALAQAKADLASAESTLAGQELSVPLELSQTTSKVASARSQLSSLLKSLEQARKDEDAARQTVVQAQAQMEQAQLDLTRLHALKAKDVVAQADIDTASTRSRTAQAETQSAKAKLEGLGHHRASLEADISRFQADIQLAESGEDQAAIKNKEAMAQSARVDLAKERVRQAELNLSYTHVVAPAAGRVTKKRVEAGQSVAVGQPLMAIVPLDPKELWITANYKETQLAGVLPGQLVHIAVDGFPGLTLKGRVDSVMAGTGSAFSLFPPENATGNYVKVVQRIPVKIVLETEGQNIPELRLGMSAIPTIFTR